MSTNQTRCPHCTEDHPSQIEPIKGTQSYLCNTCGKTFVLVSAEHYRRMIDPADDREL